MKRRILDFLRVLCSPSCWVQVYNYSAAWDRRLNALMEEHKFRDPDRGMLTAQIGSREVWIGNHPYASFTPWPNSHGIRASRATVLRAHRKLIADLPSVKENY